MTLLFIHENRIETVKLMSLY